MCSFIKNVLSLSRLYTLYYVRVFRVFVSRRLSVADRKSIILFCVCHGYCVRAPALPNGKGLLHLCLEGLDDIGSSHPLERCPPSSTPGSCPTRDLRHQDQRVTMVVRPRTSRRLPRPPFASERRFFGEGLGPTPVGEHLEIRRHPKTQLTTSQASIPNAKISAALNARANEPKCMWIVNFRSDPTEEFLRAYIGPASRERGGGNLKRIPSRPDELLLRYRPRHSSKRVCQAHYAGVWEETMYRLDIAVNDIQPCRYSNAREIPASYKNRKWGASQGLVTGDIVRTAPTYKL